MKTIAALLILLSQLSNGPYTFTANALTIPSRGVTIPAIFTVPRVAGKYPLVVMAHGHGGTKDENGGFTAIAKTLAAHGIATNFPTERHPKLLAGKQRLQS